MNFFNRPRFAPDATTVRELEFFALALAQQLDAPLQLRDCRLERTNFSGELVAQLLAALPDDLARRPANALIALIERGIPSIPGSG